MTAPTASEVNAIFNGDVSAPFKGGNVDAGELRSLLVQLVESLSGGSDTLTSPLGITGCVLWLDASDATTINAGSPVDGDAVSLWIDKSNSSYDAAQATSDNQPVYKTAQMNGRSVIRFDPAIHARSLQLSGAGLNLLRAAEGFTVAYTVQNMDTANNVNGLISIKDGMGSARLYYEVQKSMTLAASNVDGVDNSVSLALETSTTTLSTNVLPPMSIVSAADLMGGMFEAEGTYRRSTANDSVTFTSLGAIPDTAALQVAIGALYDDTGDTDGDIAEIIVYDRALNNAERRQLLEYLSAKWGTL